MKLLREFHSPEEYQHIVKEDPVTKEKDVFLRGIFAQSEITNKNGRIYPKSILERECNNLQAMIKENRLVGNLDHPPENPEIRLQDAAILITRLELDDNNVIGEAKILKSTPQGAILYGLAKDGVKIGTSTRGLGSIEEKSIDGNMVKVVAENFKWITSDAVADPSAPEAFLNSILEKKEWIFENGGIKEDKAQTYYNMAKSMPKAQLESGIVTLFQDFMNDIKGGKPILENLEPYFVALKTKTITDDQIIRIVELALNPIYENDPRVKALFEAALNDAQAKIGEQYRAHSELCSKGNQVSCKTAEQLKGKAQTMGFKL